MNYVNFNGAEFQKVNFFDVNMTMCTMTNITVYGDVYLYNVNMTGCTGFDISQWHLESIRSTILPNGTFILRGQ
jgi:uncharacterized protein YjbI with pentapeptide repeats